MINVTSVLQTIENYSHKSASKVSHKPRVMDVLSKIDGVGIDFWGETDCATFSSLSLIIFNYDSNLNLLFIETIDTLFQRICIRLIN